MVRFYNFFRLNPNRGSINHKILSRDLSYKSYHADVYGLDNKKSNDNF